MKWLKQSLFLGWVAVFGASACQAGVLSVQAVNGTDAGSGISPGNTYTHLVDFDPNNTPATVNGVTFTQAGTSGTNYTTSGFPSTFTGNDTATGFADLVNDFYYDGPAGVGDVETINLTGLTPNTTYDLRLYAKAFEAGGTRTASVADSQGGALASYNQDANPFQYLNDRYTTAASGTGSTTLSISFTVQSSGNSQHMYGFTNQVVPEPASLGLLALGGMSLLARRRTT